MTNAKRAKQTDLFKSMQLLRLQNDMKLVNLKFLLCSLSDALDVGLSLLLSPLNKAV